MHKPETTISAKNTTAVDNAENTSSGFMGRRVIIAGMAMALLACAGTTASLVRDKMAWNTIRQERLDAAIAGLSRIPGADFYETDEDGCDMDGGTCYEVVVVGDAVTETDVVFVPVPRL